VSWAWYGAAWQAALDHRGGDDKPNFQSHHQPFNFFKNFAPGPAARAEHLRDGKAVMPPLPRAGQQRLMTRPAMESLA